MVIELTLTATSSVQLLLVPCPPELNVTSSVDVGTWPQLQVPPDQVEVLFERQLQVAARATPPPASRTTTAHRNPRTVDLIKLGTQASPYGIGGHRPTLSRPPSAARRGGHAATPGPGGRCCAPRRAPRFGRGGPSGGPPRDRVRHARRSSGSGSFRADPSRCCAPARGSARRTARRRPASGARGFLRRRLATAGARS